MRHFYNAHCATSRASDSFEFFVAVTVNCHHRANICRYSYVTRICLVKLMHVRAIIRAATVFSTQIVFGNMVVWWCFRSLALLVLNVARLPRTWCSSFLFCVLSLQVTIRFALFNGGIQNLRCSQSLRKLLHKD